MNTEKTFESIFNTLLTNEQTSMLYIPSQFNQLNIPKDANGEPPVVILAMKAHIMQINSCKYKSFQNNVLIVTKQGKEYCLYQQMPERVSLRYSSSSFANIINKLVLLFQSLNEPYAYRELNVPFDSESMDYGLMDLNNPENFEEYRAVCEAVDIPCQIAGDNINENNYFRIQSNFLTMLSKKNGDDRDRYTALFNGRYNLCGKTESLMLVCEIMHDKSDNSYSVNKVIPIYSGNTQAIEAIVCFARIAKNYFTLVHTKCYSIKDK